jgi:FkbM family methyltransferase
MKKILRRLLGGAMGVWVKFERMKRCLGVRQTFRVWRQERRLPAGQLLSVQLIGDDTAVQLRARSSDLEVLLKVFSEREYDLPLQKKPQTILDGGANVGFAAVRFAQLFPDAKIVAVEPDLGNLALLKLNTARYQNIHVVDAALWSQDSFVELEDPGMAEHAFRVAGLASSGAPSLRRVRALSIGTVASEASVGGFDLVKLDIEGAEKEVLRDRTWLAPCQVLVVELHDRFVAGCSKQFYHAIDDFAGDYLMGENTIAFRRGWIADKFIEQGYWAASQT